MALAPAEVARFAESGNEAARLTRLVAEAQLAWLREGRPFGLPLIGLIDLEPGERAALDEHLP